MRVAGITRWTLRIALIILLAALFADFRYNDILYNRSTPPANVKDITGCLEWLQFARNSYRIADSNKVYYLITGPPGRTLSSGPAAYAFTEQGKLMDWTPDIGDLRIPFYHLSSKAKSEKLPLRKLRALFPRQPEKAAQAQKQEKAKPLAKPVPAPPARPVQAQFQTTAKPAH